MTETARKIIAAMEAVSRHPNQILEPALMLRQIVCDLEPDKGEYPILADLVNRIYNVMPHMDEPRYAMHDYADAIANANNAVDAGKLLGLESDDDFAAAMIWLATDKRETYEDRGHSQEPLELDIFIKPIAI